MFTENSDNGWHTCHTVCVSPASQGAGWPVCACPGTRFPHRRNGYRACPGQHDRFLRRCILGSWCAGRSNDRHRRIYGVSRRPRTVVRVRRYRIPGWYRGWKALSSGEFTYPGRIGRGIRLTTFGLPTDGSRGAGRNGHVGMALGRDGANWRPETSRPSQCVPRQRRGVCRNIEFVHRSRSGYERSNGSGHRRFIRRSVDASRVGHRSQSWRVSRRLISLTSNRSMGISVSCRGFESLRAYTLLRLPHL